MAPRVKGASPAPQPLLEAGGDVVLGVEPLDLDSRIGEARSSSGPTRARSCAPLLRSQTLLVLSAHLPEDIIRGPGRAPAASVVHTDGAIRGKPADFGEKRNKPLWAG